VERFFRFNRYVMLWGKILIGAIMIGATFLLFINVVLRYAFESGIVWAEEMTRYTLLWTVFVGAGVVTREGTHVSMEAFFNLWPAKLQRIGFLVINLFCIATISVIIYFGIGMVRLAAETDQISEAAFLPMWIIYGAFPVGGLLMILGYVETAVRQWRNIPLISSDIAFTHGRH
jgi:C4-dicarboxylate transporter DctQ subunit